MEIVTLMINALVNSGVEKTIVDRMELLDILKQNLIVVKTLVRSAFEKDQNDFWFTFFYLQRNGLNGLKLNLVRYIMIKLKTITVFMLSGKEHVLVANAKFNLKKNLSSVNQSMEIGQHGRMSMTQNALKLVKVIGSSSHIGLVTTQYL